MRSVVQHGRKLCPASKSGDGRIIGSSFFANLNLDPLSIRGSRNLRADTASSGSEEGCERDLQPM